MPELRLPSKSVLRILLEVVLISAGVFLGLMGEQWRDASQRRQAAEGTLRRFRTEIAANRVAVAAVADYHVTSQTEVNAFLRADAKARESISLNFSGVRPARFEHTAWDLALATQSLADIDADLAFALSRAYAVQQEYGELSSVYVQGMYMRPPTADPDPFLQVVSVYYADITRLEPELLAMYDTLLPRIDGALGDTPAGE